MAARIAIIGAGLMGHGIALTLARAGHQINLFDPQEHVRDAAIARIEASLRGIGTDDPEVSAITTRIRIDDTLEHAVDGTAFVFEAAPEKLPLKQQIFAEAEASAPRDAILASNTSVIQISKIMDQLKHRERALGTHWWNPPHLIPLVEMIKTAWTSDEAITATYQLLEGAGKTPVRVEKDVPGFIGNRLQHALWREAVSLVENGICDAEAVDTVIKSSFGRRLAVLGPLENADLVGTDLTLDIHHQVLFDLENRPEPSAYLKKLVADGKLGMKSGEGFRQWDDQAADELKQRVAKHLAKLETLLKK